MYKEMFAARLSQLRLQKNVSARDMSLSIGQNPAYINNIETGKALPSMSAFFYICEYLDVSPKDFFDTDSTCPKDVRSITEKLVHLSEKKLKDISNIIDDLSE
jgi:transcriptional regulator with XRE-family HTH domain